MGNIQWYMWEGLNKVILRLPTATITMSHLTELAWGYSISAATIDAVGEMLNDAETRILVFPRETQRNWSFMVTEPPTTLTGGSGMLSASPS